MPFRMAICIHSRKEKEAIIACGFRYACCDSSVQSTGSKRID